MPTPPRGLHTGQCGLPKAIHAPYAHIHVLPPLIDQVLANKNAWPNPAHAAWFSPSP